jgi:ammonium transporter, Amt family
MAVTPTAHDRRLRRQRAVSRGSPQHPRSYRRWTTHSLSSTVHTYAVAGLHLHVVVDVLEGLLRTLGFLHGPPPPPSGCVCALFIVAWNVVVTTGIILVVGIFVPLPAAHARLPAQDPRATTRRTGRALWGDGEKFEVTRNEAARACAWGDCIREETAEQRSTGCGWPEWEAEASPIQL